MKQVSKPPMDLWITQAGYPQLHRRYISQSKEILKWFMKQAALQPHDEQTA